ncbi:tRNA pseudouridine(55) synthase TruB [soil metagenome]
MVARVRKLTGVRKVGHAGTLDPFATGLLVVGVGKATRMIQYVQRTTKVYQASLKLGEETDTLDLEGSVAFRCENPVWPSRQDVETAIAESVGTIDQVPPAHSAIHIDGKRAYERARAGEQVDIPTRTVVIHSISVDSYNAPSLDLTVTCETGTYIRSLARDIGRRLGVYAYCTALRRVAVGAFHIDDAVELEGLTGDDFRDRWTEVAIPPDVAVEGFKAIMLTEDQTTAWYHGQSLPEAPGTPGGDSDTLVRVYSASGGFAGLGTYDGARGLRPVLVFTTG